MREDTQEEGKGSVGAIRPLILLAEDDDEMRVLLGRALRKAGYRVIEDYDATSLFHDLISFLFSEKRNEPIDLIISDIRMPGPHVMEILGNMHETRNFPPVILITAFGDKEIHATAERYGVVALFDKPFDIDKLIAKVQETVALPG
ncbi:MAG: response regulator [bacterium]